MAVLRVSGTLDLVTGDALQLAVRRSLAVQPTHLLLDVADLRVGDPLALAALGTVICETAEWPSIPIVLCGCDPRTYAMISAYPDCAGLRYAPSCAAALAEAGTAPTPPKIRVRLRPVPDACRQVRQLVSQACTAWHRAELTATASLIATELVANVVRHAHTTMEFTLGLQGGRLSMTVRDGSRRLPRPVDTTPSDAGGRGLQLVRDLTEAWGVLPVPDGKVVWTRLTSA
ncbi:ATP-binding protein [Actinoplanes sp. TBRC 11911]|uniref:ATP-binding protein n=1 Tax=Actinoplanes sp. TBRC 11911 TaxID=2729386 RepID=UPI00289F928E|nr:ATP-binding protein [Actinoplanes sp. TBRC 11911]